MSSTAGKKISRDFLANIENLHEILFLIDEAGSLLITEKSVLYKIRLGCEEAVVNIIKHGYASGNQGIIHIECWIEGGKLMIVLEDNGVAFNPLEYSKSLTSIQRPENGGMGIQLMLKAADRIHYLREGNKNHLSLTFDIN
jgi:anti-sigma regulatory factor (Ser/Thr protein kinase)